MREIKFRVWNKIDKEMVYCSSMEVEDNNRGLICYGNVYGADKIMEYTGLKDKNGKEIYEGDIIKIRAIESYITVEWDLKTGEYIGEIHHKKEIEKIEEVKWKIDGYSLIHPSYDDWEIEVVGNIYENPELLEGDKNG